MTESDQITLELFVRDKSMSTPFADRQEMPAWEEVDSALNRVFDHGGNARLEVLSPADFYVRSLCVEALPNQFRIFMLTRDCDPKRQLLEWWRPSAAAFEGRILFGENEWDSRMVSGNLSLAKDIFREFFDDGRLSEANLLAFRSQWDPLP